MSLIAFWFLAGLIISNAQGPVAPGELVAPKIEISGSDVKFTVQPSVAGRKYQLQASETLASGMWQDLGGVLTGDGGNLVLSTPFVPETPRRFYRLALDGASGVPDGFALIPAGSFAANGYGLYDMAGNMWEWCWDWHGSYPSGSQTDPRGASNGYWRVLRGGGWDSYGILYGTRCACRNYHSPGSAGLDGYGFRLARGQP